MNYLKAPILILIIAIAVNSCKKDKPTSVVSYPDYSGLKVGNYWIYERFNVDTLGNATSINIYDSVFVEKDTVINNSIYFKLYTPNAPPIWAGGYGYQFLRDSLHYIINSSGRILFSSEDFTTVFREYYEMVNGTDTVGRGVTKMDEKDVAVSTPAGIFVTSDFRETYYIFPGFSYGPNPRYTHSRYAKDIGLVIETLPWYLANPNTVERRLVRYSVN